MKIFLLGLILLASCGENAGFKALEPMPINKKTEQQLKKNEVTKFTPIKSKLSLVWSKESIELNSSDYISDLKQEFLNLFEDKSFFKLNLLAHSTPVFKMSYVERLNLLNKYASSINTESIKGHFSLNKKYSGNIYFYTSFNSEMNYLTQIENKDAIELDNSQIEFMLKNDGYLLIGNSNVDKKTSIVFDGEKIQVIQVESKTIDESMSQFDKNYKLSDVVNFIGKIESDHKRWKLSFLNGNFLAIWDYQEKLNKTDESLSLDIANYMIDRKISDVPKRIEIHNPKFFKQQNRYDTDSSGNGVRNLLRLGDWIEVSPSDVAVFMRGKNCSYEITAKNVFEYDNGEKTNTVTTIVYDLVEIDHKKCAIESLQFRSLDYKKLPYVMKWLGYWEVSGEEYYEDFTRIAGVANLLF